MARTKDISPIYQVIPCTPGSSAFPETRAILVTVAGTIDIVDGTGNAVSAVPVVVGMNPLQVTKITAATATGLFLGY